MSTMALWNGTDDADSFDIAARYGLGAAAHADGGAGNDRSVGGAGLDLLGSGTDTLTLALTAAQWQSAAIQADIAGLSASFASPLGQTQAYIAASLHLSAVAFEKIIVAVDGNYAPTDIALSAATIAENAAGGGIGSLTTTDATPGDSFAYSVDDSRFEVVGGVLGLKAGLALDYETASSVALTVTVTDNSGLSIARAFAIAVTNVNEAPAVTSASTASFAENGTGTVYTATGSDPDAGTTLSYALTGTDAGLFTINASTGIVTFKAAPNFEAPADADANNTYDVSVTASDGQLSASKPLAITVTNVNEAPTLKDGIGVPDYLTVVSGATPASLASYFIDPDAGATLSFSLVASTLPNTITLNPGGTFSGSSAQLGSYTVTVKATDQFGLSVQDTFTLSVVSSNSTTGTSQPDYLDFRGSANAVNVNGGNGSDTLYGSGGSDTLNDGNSNSDDTMWGGAGDDVLYSGSDTDHDKYLYNEAHSGNDQINGFDVTKDQIVFTKATTGVINTDYLRIENGTTVVGGSRVAATIISWGPTFGLSHDLVGQGSIALVGKLASTVVATDFAFV